MSDTSRQTTNVGIMEGVLTIIPTRKGEQILVNDTELLWLLNQYNGKAVRVTIQEVGECDTCSHWNEILGLCPHGERDECNYHTSNEKEKEAG